MKRLLYIVIVCLWCSVFSAVAQTDSLKVETIKEKNAITKTILLRKDAQNAFDILGYINYFFSLSAARF